MQPNTIFFFFLIRFCYCLCIESVAQDNSSYSSVAQRCQKVGRPWATLHCGTWCPKEESLRQLQGGLSRYFWRRESCSLHAVRGEMLPETCSFLGSLCN